MTLIRNKKFKTLVNSIANYTQEKYLGMGNPDSKILLVGSEKALSPTHEEDMIIRNHELLNNHYQWYDIINHYNYLTDNFDSVILKRGHAFAGSSRGMVQEATTTKGMTMFFIFFMSGL